MEYRRRRRNRRRAGRSRGFGFSAAGTAVSQYRGADAYARRTGGGGALTTLLMLLLIGGIVYVFVGTPVGAWIIGKLKGLGKSGGTPLPTLPPAVTQAPCSADPDEAEMRSEEMQFPGVDMYGLQIGVYDSLENAKGLIATLHSLGAAGYGLKTDAGYRVLASCYTTEEAAMSVCERLTQQGYACIVFAIRQDGIDISVSAQEEQLDAIRAAVELSHGLVDDLNEAVLAFDTDEHSAQYGKAIIGEKLESIRAVRASIADIDDRNGVVKLMDGFFSEAEKACSELCSNGSGNRVEISGLMKSLQICIVDKYCSLIEEMRKLVP